jgi:hypothetical protein
MGHHAEWHPAGVFLVVHLTYFFISLVILQFLCTLSPSLYYHLSLCQIYCLTPLCIGHIWPEGRGEVALKGSHKTWRPLFIFLLEGEKEERWRYECSRLLDFWGLIDLCCYEWSIEMSER